MTSERRKEQRIIAYGPSYLKKAVSEYVQKTKDMSMSEFIVVAVKEKLDRVNGTQKIKG